MAASSLAIVTSSFPPGPQLHRAIGLWAAMNGLGGAAGVLFGGIITQALSWRWVLLINPPIGIVTALIAFAVVADRRRDRAGRNFDIPGALTLTVGQMILVYGVVEAGLRGWHDALALGPILVGLAMLAGFMVIETRFASDPLIPFKDLAEGAQRRQRHRLVVQRRAVPDVVRELALSAAGARAISAEGGTPVPADGADDHGGRPQRRQAGQPLRRASGARRRPDHDDVRDAVVHEDRRQRQPNRLRGDPGGPDRGGNRHVDRPLDDRRDPRSQTWSGRARIGARQHLPAGRRRARTRGPDHTCHLALEPPDRPRARGAAGADRRLPARVLHRRRPVRRPRGAGHVRAGAEVRRGRAARSPGGSRSRSRSRS